MTVVDGDCGHVMTAYYFTCCTVSGYTRHTNAETTEFRKSD